MLTLRLFGGVSVERAGEPVAGPAVQRRRLAILALLAVHQNSGLTRDKLLAWLWPETPDGPGRRLLSNALYVLRGALGADVIRSIGTDTLRLGQDRLRVDLSEFLMALETGDRERAVELYSGPFLDGFFVSNAPEFDRWVESQRERLADLQAGALESLAEEAESAGDLPAAVDWWRRLARHSPFSSRTATRLMSALAASGDPAGALRHAELHQTLMRDELGIEPDGDVVALVARLRRGDRPRPGPATAVGSSGSPSARQRGPAAQAVGPAPSDIDGPPAAPPQGESPAAEPGARPRRTVVTVDLAGSVVLVALASLALGALPHGLADAGPSPASRSAATADPATPSAAVAMAEGTHDPEAQLLYLQGRHAWNQRTEESIQQALRFFEAAVQHDPDFARAHWGIAESYALLGEYAGTPVRERVAPIIAHATRALEIEPAMAGPRVTLADAYTQLWNWELAEREFRRAIALDPDHATAHHWYSQYLRAVGRPSQALAALRRAKELDPLSLVIRANLVDVYLVLGAIDSAETEASELLALEPNSPLSQGQMGLVLMESRRLDGAIGHLERAVMLGGGWRPLAELGQAYALRGRRTDAIAVLERLETEWGGRESGGMGVAMVALALDDSELAYQWLERELDARSAQLPTIRWWVVFRPLWGQPRFDRILRRMGLVV